MYFKHIELDLDFTPLLEANYDSHTGSCIKHQVHELTDIHNEYGGFPDSYCLANTKIHQLWWTDEQLDFESIGNELNMQVVTVSTIKQPPGCVVPYHRDTFFQISQRFPDRKERKVRANIFLNDYRMGQFLQYKLDGKFETCTDWKAGEGFMWDSDILHVSANAGFQDKYTMQVSGFLND